MGIVTELSDNVLFTVVAASFPFIIMLFLVIVIKFKLDLNSGIARLDEKLSTIRWHNDSNHGYNAESIREALTLIKHLAENSDDFKSKIEEINQLVRPDTGIESAISLMDEIDDPGIIAEKTGIPIDLARTMLVARRRNMDNTSSTVD